MIQEINGPKKEFVQHGYGCSGIPYPYQKALVETGEPYHGPMMPKASFDPISKPRHYNNLNHKGIECIDAMEAMLTKEEFIGYLRGNVFKYLWRYRYKNYVEDLKKAQWYLNKLLEVLQKEPTTDFRIKG